MKSARCSLLPPLLFRDVSCTLKYFLRFVFPFPNNFPFPKKQFSFHSKAAHLNFFFRLRHSEGAESLRWKRWLEGWWRSRERRDVRGKWRWERIRTPSARESSPKSDGSDFVCSEKASRENRSRVIRQIPWMRRKGHWWTCVKCATMQHSISSYSVAFEPANCKNRTTVSWRNREKDFLCVILEQQKSVCNVVEANLAEGSLEKTQWKWCWRVESIFLLGNLTQFR